ncbi:MAG: molybdate ABC transporter substrate-binding protein [Akkermansiaceae bacterium]|nr:molybdate ABC transporter substrate-binding protein [Armatimonadota bacterium]
MPATSLTVAAASSLAPILPALIAAWNRDHETVIRPTFGASGTLLRQIAAGAPVDVFLSAGDKEVNELVGLRAVRPATRTAFAENRLVLAQATSARIQLTGWADLLELPARFRIALGKPETVPAGRYAREALRKHGMYEDLQRQKRLVFTGTVRQAADAAASGNVDAALVFATDVRADKRLRAVVTAVPGTDHMPIRYVAIVTKQARNEAEAVSFVRFLRSEPARRVFKAAGFVVLD